jgi:hypothetical protein
VSFRTTLATAIGEQLQPVLGRFGAVLAQGVLMAGGQNTTIRVCREAGHVDDASVVGLLLFTQVRGRPGTAALKPQRADGWGGAILVLVLVPVYQLLGLGAATNGADLPQR